MRAGLPIATLSLVACIRDVTRTPPGNSWIDVDMRYGSLYAACALARDGATRCWGANAPSEPPVLPDAVGIDFGAETCLQLEGSARCFGAKGTLRRTFDDVVGVAAATRSRAGTTYCTLDTEGVLECSPASVAVPVREHVEWFEMSTGSVCSIAGDGSAVCDPLVPGGAPPTGTAATSLAFPPERWTQVAAQGSLACALNERGEILCYSNHEALELGLPPATAISVSGSVLCLIQAEDDRPRCVDAGIDGELPATDSPLQKVVAGAFVACGLTLEGSLECWHLRPTRGAI